MMLCSPVASIEWLLVHSVGLVLMTLLLNGTDCSAADYDIYLLAGQSNMDGRGAVSDLDEKDLVSFDNAIIFYRNLPASSNDWKPLAPGFSIPVKYKGGLPSPTFGPELGFAKTMLKTNPKKKLALIKGSKGGTSLRVDWNPGTHGDPSSQGRRYRDFIETISIATKKLSERGDTYTIRGLLWHQGESDRKLKTETYQRLLKKMISRIRKDVDVLDLPVIVGEVFDDGRRDNVRAAINAVGTSGDKIGLVKSDGLTTWDPGTHFDAVSQLELGKRYAQAILKLDGGANAAAVGREIRVDSNDSSSNPKSGTEQSPRQTIGAEN